MSRFHSYLNSTVQILSEYDGKSPFSLFIKKFFNRHKKFGSRDRWLISDYCFFYFRLGKALPDLSMEERILTGIFLCAEAPNNMLATHKPEWNEVANAELTEKCALLGISYQELLGEMFPWSEELSDSIDWEKYTRSFFSKPDVFLRIRPGREQSVRLRLKSAHIPFKDLGTHTLSVAPGAKVDRVLSMDSSVVVQDLNSQKTGEVFNEVLSSEGVTVWDCCAASGGKSIMAYDFNPKIALTVTDIRPHILRNLEQRFESAGITDYEQQVADLTHPIKLKQEPFEVIIADVPCTGSGTWARTPEQLFTFDQERIAEYASLQQAIINMTVPKLKPSGFLIYITCSVFALENERNVEEIANMHHLSIIDMQLLEGYTQKADSMFVALLKK